MTMNPIDAAAWDAEARMIEAGTGFDAGLMEGTRQGFLAAYDDTPEGAYLLGLYTGFVEGRRRRLAFDKLEGAKERRAKPLRIAKGAAS